MVAAAIVQSFQSIVARSVHPMLGGVVTIGSIQGGMTHNVIPETVRMLGTARWFEPEVGDTIERAVLRLAHSVAEGYGAAARRASSGSIRRRSTIPEAMALGRRAAEPVAGAARVEQMAHADHGRRGFQLHAERQAGRLHHDRRRHRPDDAMLHHPGYDFNDEILPVGASYWATLAETILPAD